MFHSAPALDALVKALDDLDLEVRANSARTLWWVHNYDRESLQPLALRLLDVLLKGLKHPDAKGREIAAQVLALTGPMASSDEDAIPALIAALEDSDATVRASAADALRAYEERAERAVPALRKACKDPVERVRAMARGAIGGIEK
jgi:HEAT repeat protein